MTQQLTVAGDWTALEQRLLINNNLTRVAIAKGLDNHIVAAPGLARVSAKMMATAVEAIVGAAYRDGGEEAVDTVMRAFGLHAPELEVTLSTPPPSPDPHVQELLHKINESYRDP
jgi:dsRNA-specific ribonuclease